MAEGTQPVCLPTILFLRPLRMPPDIAPYGDYLTIRPTVFAGMHGAAMDREIRKCNRE